MGYAKNVLLSNPNLIFLTGLVPQEARKVLLALPFHQLLPLIIVRQFPDSFNSNCSLSRKPLEKTPNDIRQLATFISNQKSLMQSTLFNITHPQSNISMGKVSTSSIHKFSTLTRKETKNGSTISFTYVPVIQAVGLLVVLWVSQHLAVMIIK